MKKIAHICTAASMHKLLVDKLSIQQKQGYEIDIISSKTGYNPILLENYDLNVKFVNMEREINIAKDLISIADLVKVFKKERYEIVHTHNAKAGIIGRTAARIAKVPLILHTTHGLPYYNGQNKLKYNIYRWIEKAGSVLGHGLASQNKEDMNLLINDIKILRRYFFKRPVYFEGNGIDLQRIDAVDQSIKESDLQKIRKKHSIDEYTKVILMGARFEPVKDHTFLLNGLKHFIENYKHEPFVCLLAGDGELVEEVQSKIKELNLEEYVNIIGYQNDIYKYIKLADVVTLTSEKEGIPRILMESMGMKKPIIATDVLGTRELIQDNENGYLVTYPETYADKLNQLLSNEILRRKFGESGRKIIEDQFTEEKVVDRIEYMYQDINEMISNGEFEIYRDPSYLRKTQ